MSTGSAHPDDHQEQLVVPLAAEDVAALGSDGERLDRAARHRVARPGAAAQGPRERRRVRGGH
ncbi:hypothetical protein [Streptomyces altiplanensis]